MLSEELIIELRDKVIEVKKQGNVSDKYKKHYTPAYPLKVKMREEIAVHAEFEGFPEKLFETRAPYATKEQWDYLKATFRPVTFPYFQRGVNATRRIWNTQNYELRWDEEAKEEDGKTLQSKYFTEDYPVFGSLLSYFESVVHDEKCKDANAVLAVRPRYIPTTLNSLGEPVFDDSLPVEPIAVIYPADKVLFYQAGEYAVCESEEKSVVQYEGKPQEVGLVLDIYSIGTIYQLRQIGRKIDWEFELIEYWKQEDLDVMPAKELGGEPVRKGKELIHKSPFYNTIPLLDTALYDFTLLNVTKPNAAFPKGWEMAEECTAEGCINGKVHSDDNETGLTNCHVCKGTGTKSIFQQGFQVAQVKPPGRLDGDIPLPTPPFGYVTPELTGLEFFDRQFEKQVARAFANLSIDVSAEVASGRETATGKLIDREELFSFLLTFASELFDLFGFAAYCIGRMRYGKNFVEPVISKPVTFAMRSEADLVEELKLASEANMPEPTFRRLYSEYNAVRFTNSEEITKSMDIAMSVDALAMMKPVDVADGLLNGVIHKWEAYLHTRIHQFIEEAVEEDKNFLNRPMKEIRKILYDRAKAEVPEETKVDYSQIMRTRTANGEEE